MTDLNLMTPDTELVRIDQLPVLEEFFTSMYEPVRARIAEILSEECTVDNRVEVEAMRTEIRKFRDDIKAALKDKKEQLFAPWKMVEDSAAEILKMCDAADGALKNRTEAIKNAQKKQTEDEIRTYYAEKCASLGIDWLEYERIGLKIRLNDSLKALRKSVDAVTERIAGEVTAILAMPDNAEIMAEYKARLNLGDAVAVVTERRARIVAEAAKMDALTERKQAAEERAQAVEKAAEQREDNDKPLAPPVVKPAPAVPDPASEKVFRMTFTVTGTREQLVGLKRYLIDNNINIIE